ncbi:MAG: 5-formyltetrahydrofolate cyclo-ligase [Cytophagaceae bacterium]|nr:5-formyltetrahydrofolate cyclo-ligase [Cytophagaceae bacterium]
MMTKAELRVEFRARRRQVSETEVEQLNQRLTDRFFREIDLTSVRVLHSFLSSERLREVDTFSLLRQLHASFPNIQIVVPRTDFETGQLEPVAWTPNTPLTINSFSLPEPGSGPGIDPRRIDLVLIPLLAFDTHGHRVGYGGGFYDRFLAQCHPNVGKLGLSWFGPVEKITDTRALDVPLDACLTPEKIYHFAAGTLPFLR